MRSNEFERPEVNADEVRAKALSKKVSAYFDNDKVQSLVDAYGVEVLANEETAAQAFQAVSEQYVPTIISLIAEDFGLEISADEAIDALKTVLSKKLAKFLSTPAETEDTTATDVVAADDVVTGDVVTGDVVTGDVALVTPTAPEEAAV